MRTPDAWPLAEVRLWLQSVGRVAERAPGRGRCLDAADLLEHRGHALSIDADGAAAVLRCRDCDRALVRADLPAYAVEYWRADHGGWVEDGGVHRTLAAAERAARERLAADDALLEAVVREGEDLLRARAVLWVGRPTPAP